MFLPINLSKEVAGWNVGACYYLMNGLLGVTSYKQISENYSRQATYINDLELIALYLSGKPLARFLIILYGILYVTFHNGL